VKTRRRAKRVKSLHTTHKPTPARTWDENNQKHIPMEPSEGIRKMLLILLIFQFFCFFVFHEKSLRSDFLVSDFVLILGNILFLLLQGAEER
jgi:hypothetical protein